MYSLALVLSAMRVSAFGVVPWRILSPSKTEVSLSTARISASERDWGLAWRVCNVCVCRFPRLQDSSTIYHHIVTFIYKAFLQYGKVYSAPNSGYPWSERCSL